MEKISKELSTLLSQHKRAGERFKEEYIKRENARKESRREQQGKAYRLYLKLIGIHTREEIVGLFKMLGIRTVSGLEYNVYTLDRLRKYHVKKNSGQ